MAALSLTFPRAVFAKLSPHPYLLANLSNKSSDKPCRTNGRAPQDARPIHINTSSLSHAHGSALVRTGDTTVVCGVRGEILPIASIPQYRHRTALDEQRDDGDDDAAVLKNYDLLVPNIELTTGCAPHLLPGVPPTALAQTLSTRLYSLLHGCRLVKAKDLEIWRNRASVATGQDLEEDTDGLERPKLAAYWTLYIDLLFVSFDGNPFDAAVAAMVAALRDTTLPVARWDEHRDMVLCSPTETRGLDIRGLPVACTAAVFMEREHRESTAEGRHWLLLDPDRLEESLCRETVTMVVDCSQGETRIRGIEKHGGTVLGREMLRGFATVAEARWRAVETVMFA